MSTILIMIFYFDYVSMIFLSVCPQLASYVCVSQLVGKPYECV